MQEVVMRPTFVDDQQQQINALFFRLYLEILPLSVCSLVTEKAQNREAIATRSMKPQVAL